ncbi:signal transduction histidine kinase [Kitasatospora sp. GP30]|nr:signal transduction histidine kinase [Kitasatospora sp. GP30]
MPFGTGAGPVGLPKLITMYEVLAVLMSAGALLGAVLAGWGGRVRPALAAGCVGGGSTALTAAGWWARPYQEGDRLSGLAGVLELLALLLLVALAVRAGRQQLALAPAGLAALLWPLRFMHPPTWTEQVQLLGFGTGGLAVAALVGRYLGALDQRRHREVAATRRAQRLELAHDLHDFVAHDVSGMVAQAQAGAILAQQHPEQAAAVFQRIEQAGQQALTALDRTVRLLRTEQQAGEREPQHGLDELPALTDRFIAAGSVEVRLRSSARQVSREVGATAYRIVVEALTNVRRHAATATRVEVSVRSTGGQLEVRITDDGRPGDRRTRRDGGHGLAALGARVEALGGTFNSGRTEDGWQVQALLPLAGEAL